MAFFASYVPWLNNADSDFYAQYTKLTDTIYEHNITLWNMHSCRPHVAGVTCVMKRSDYIVVATFEMNFRMFLLYGHRRFILYTTARNMKCLSPAEVSGYYGNNALKYEYFISPAQIVIKRYYCDGAKRQHTIIKADRSIWSEQYYPTGQLFRSIINMPSFTYLWVVNEFHRCGTLKHAGKARWGDIDMVRPN